MPLFPIAAPLTALGDVGGQAFSGLLQGGELDRKRRLQEQQAAHQGFLERLEQARLDFDRQRQAENARRLNAYLTRGQHISIGGGRLLKVNPDGTTQIIDAGPPQETPQQRAAREAAEATTRFRTKQTELLGQPKPAQIPAEHEKLFQDWQIKHPGGSYLDFYNEVVKPPKPAKEPTSLDALLAKASDPDVPMTERARARSQADEIIKAREGIQRAGAENRADIKKGQEKEKANKALARANTLLNQLDALVQPMAEKGFLSKTDDVSSYWAAKAKRSHLVPGVGKPGDPTLGAWLAHEGTMVSIMRDLGDLGPRAMQAFQSAMRVVSEPTTPAAAQAVFRQLREAVNAYQGGREQQYEQGVGGVPRAVPYSGHSNAIKDRIKVIGPNGERGSVPPGTDMSRYPGWKVAQ